jgi:hypothetical protein
MNVATGISRVINSRTRGWVVQHQVRTEGGFGSTNPKEATHWITAYTVAQALSPTFSRVCNK